MVAVAEAFSIDPLLAGWPSTPPAITGTWKKREKAWRDVGADLAAATSWFPLMGYVKVRNAIHCGLGRLTDHQLDRRDEDEEPPLELDVVQAARSSMPVSPGRRCRPARPLARRGDEH